MAIVVTDIQRPDPDITAKYITQKLGVATVHEAQGRTGLLIHQSGQYSREHMFVAPQLLFLSPLATTG